MNNHFNDFFFFKDKHLEIADCTILNVRILSFFFMNYMIIFGFLDCWPDKTQHLQTSHDIFHYFLTFRRRNDYPINRENDCQINRWWKQSLVAARYITPLDILVHEQSELAVVDRKFTLFKCRKLCLYVSLKPTLARYVFNTVQPHTLNTWPIWYSHIWEIYNCYVFVHSGIFYHTGYFFFLYHDWSL